MFALRILVSISAIGSLIAIIVLVIRYFTLSIVPGWSSMIVTMFFLGGLIIASLGVVGIYVGNIFMQSKQRPLYVVRTVLNGKDKDKK